MESRHAIKVSQSLVLIRKEITRCNNIISNRSSQSSFLFHSSWTLITFPLITDGSLRKDVRIVPPYPGRLDEHTCWIHVLSSSVLDDTSDWLLDGFHRPIHRCNRNYYQSVDSIRAWRHVVHRGSPIDMGRSYLPWQCRNMPATLPMRVSVEWFCS